MAPNAATRRLPYKPFNVESTFVLAATFPEKISLVPWCQGLECTRPQPPRKPTPSGRLTR